MTGKRTGGSALLCLAGLLFATVAFAPARAQPVCALSLVLAIDASSSVDAAENRQQLDGLARAFGDEAVREAIHRVGGIQVSAYEWSGRYQQATIAPWSWLFDEASIDAFADKLAGHGRNHDEFPTALGYALGYGAMELQKAPLPCIRQVIDVSGDGVNNEGFGPPIAYRAFPFDNVVVNGLVIAGADPDPVGYYRSVVIRGSGAFVEVARDFADYEAAMKRKLLREIMGNAIASLEAAD
ncbi:MAG: DUF1194 domain-containing protein [Notoacmeibacter sp.]|nr:DUF1194 domain-containing protein [Notoacmeibacter sp.]